ncbi:MAG: hypothetical protein ACREXY_09965, partial [Gammaproteobacteria bacterium]
GRDPRPIRTAESFLGREGGAELRHGSGRMDSRASAGTDVETILHSLPDLVTPAIDRAIEHADRLLDFIEHDVVTLRTRIPLEGLRFKGLLVAGPVLLRWLEREEVARLQQIQTASLDDFAFMFAGHLGMPRTMLEVTELRAKTTPRQPAELSHRVILGLQLLGFEPFGTPRFPWREEPFPMGTHFSPAQLPPRGTAKEITQTNLERALAVAGLIPVDFAGDSSSRGNIALSRFAQGCADQYAADALIDFVIALEAVLLPPDASSELSFRFALYGAHVIGSSAEDRRNLYRDFRDVYITRSGIVHGLAMKPADVDKNAAVARRLAAQTLLRGLESGWPSQESLRDATLS